MLKIIIAEVTVREVYRQSIDAISRVAVVPYNTGLCSFSYLIYLLIGSDLLLVISVLKIGKETHHVYLLLVGKLVGFGTAGRHIGKYRRAVCDLQRCL